MEFTPIPFAFFFLGWAFLLLALFDSGKTPRRVSAHEPGLDRETAGGLAMSSEFHPPSIWDEPLIARQLEALRDQPPPLIGHYVTELKQRLILNQNDKTAVIRIRFLQHLLEQ